MIPSRLFEVRGTLITLSLANGERHFIVLTSTTAETRACVMVVTCNTVGGVSVAELFMGQNVSYDVSESNKLILTISTTVATYIADFVLNGGFITIS